MRRERRASHVGSGAGHWKATSGACGPGGLCEVRARRITRKAKSICLHQSMPSTYMALLRGTIDASLAVPGMLALSGSRRAP